jgi:hypothetical protein
LFNEVGVNAGESIENFLLDAGEELISFMLFDLASKELFDCVFNNVGLKTGTFDDVIGVGFVFRLMAWVDGDLVGSDDNEERFAPGLTGFKPLFAVVVDESPGDDADVLVF